MGSIEQTTYFETIVIIFLQESQFIKTKPKGNFHAPRNWRMLQQNNELYMKENIWKVVFPPLIIYSSPNSPLIFHLRNLSVNESFLLRNVTLIDAEQFYYFMFSEKQSLIIFIHLQPHLSADYLFLSTPQRLKKITKTVEDRDKFEQIYRQKFSYLP